MTRTWLRRKKSLISREGRPEAAASLKDMGLWVLFLPPVPSNLEHSSLSMVRSPYLLRLSESNPTIFTIHDGALHDGALDCAIGHFLILQEQKREKGIKTLLRWRETCASRVSEVKSVTSMFSMKAILRSVVRRSGRRTGGGVVPVEIAQAGAASAVTAGRRIAIPMEEAHLVLKTSAVIRGARTIPKKIRWGWRRWWHRH